jgi:hypothetical protein
VEQPYRQVSAPDADAGRVAEPDGPTGGTAGPSADLLEERVADLEAELRDVRTELADLRDRLDQLF